MILLVCDTMYNVAAGMKLEGSAREFVIRVPTPGPKHSAYMSHCALMHSALAHMRSCAHAHALAHCALAHRRSALTHNRLDLWGTMLTGWWHARAIVS